MLGGSVKDQNGRLRVLLPGGLTWGSGGFRGALCVASCGRACPQVTPCCGAQVGGAGLSPWGLTA